MQMSFTQSLYRSFAMIFEYFVCAPSHPRLTTDASPYMDSVSVIIALLDSFMPL